MVWLGGVSVALGGVFLVKYSIDQGLLTPWARVAIGTLAGFGMHVLAEWLFRKTGNRHPAFSSLAAAGSITLCAAALAALHLYELIPAAATFVFVAAVSMGTLALALRHGPVLAALGLIGSYVVPLLVGGDTGRIVGVLVYCVIVSAAVLLLIRHRFRAWLWHGMLAGATFWWLASLPGSQADGYRGPYLAMLAAAMLILPATNWRQGLVETVKSAFGAAGTGQGAGDRTVLERLPIRASLSVLVVAQGVSIFNEPFSLAAAAGWTPLVVIVFVAGRFLPLCAPLPWVSLAVQILAWVGTSLDIREFQLRWVAPNTEVQAGFPLFAAWTAVAYSALSAWNLRPRMPAAGWASLAVAAPACWLGVAFVVATGRSPSAAWAGAGVAIGLLFTLLGWTFFRRGLDSMASWMILGCSGAYSAAAAILFRDAGLTLALACQAVPLAWLAVREGKTNVAWMTKAVLATIVVRLTFNPWLPAYEQGSGWAWWTYGGSALACMLAGQVARPVPRLRRWIEATAAHLLVLGVWVVTRDWLYDGEMFVERYGFQEAAINTSVWAAVGLVYLWRSRVSEHLASVYRWTSRVLLGMSLANYVAVLAFLNPIWGVESVGATKLWNSLLLAYGAPVVLACLAIRFGEPRWSRIAGRVSALAAFAFVSLEIRHLWQGTLSWTPQADDAEMATYSVAWLAMAVGAILAGGMRFGPSVYRMGMALLLVTTCKVFLADMSGLTGLLRAGSFMGLGLSLLGLAYVHRRFKRLRVPSSVVNVESGAGIP